MPHRSNFSLSIIWLLLSLMAFEVLGQGRPYSGPDDPAGDPAAQRKGYFNGNRILVKFENNGRQGGWPEPAASKWPNDNTGSYMLDALALLLGGMVFLENDSIPVTDPVQIATRRDLDTLWFVETGYTQGVDRDPTDKIIWGLYPVFGYFSELQDYVAISNRSNSWPTDGWPARGDEKKWPGEWNGRFGRGVQYAALETYFVANDAQDQEYLQSGISVKYYPRPGVKVGDKRPDVTIQPNAPWGGLGLRVEVRGYQWNNPQTRDAVFWEYNITNISNYDIPRAAFGCWLDNGIGGGSVDDYDDIGFYDRYEDLAYSWDINGVGAGGLKPGIMGFAFLESPGIGNDNQDNDEDGLIDEQRDNIATTMVDKYANIANLTKFLKWYNMEEGDLRPHWDADEDQDWRDGLDTNENGIYDEDEDAGDDVGLDGVGPTDLNYNGPDEGECNHRPDFIEGLGCEPNFAATDISESDMIGLTAFRMIHHPQEGSPQSRFDRDSWNVFATDSVSEYFGAPANLIEIFGSGQFRLDQGRSERYSLAEIHAYEELSGLNSGDHAAPSLFAKKAIVQTIYENDYRFAQPPLMPTLTAQAGDGKVFLSWNDIADKLTREPLLRSANDFEGYKLYRATDIQFGDAELLFDGYGNPAGKKPIFQCDIIDGKKGFADFVIFNGLAFYLGNDTGLRHYFIDENVQNGRTYYYGLAAYDYGVEVFGKDQASILPSENTVVLDLDEDETIRFIGKNVQIVTPRQPAIGYFPPAFEIVSGEDLQKLCGQIEPAILSYDNLKIDHTYKIKFRETIISYSRIPLYRHPTDRLYTTSGLMIYDVTARDTLIYEENSSHFLHENLKLSALTATTNAVWHFNENGLVTDVFDGMQLGLQPTTLLAAFDPLQSGWVKGKAPLRVVASQNESIFYPGRYDIIFNNQPYRTRTTFKGSIKSFDNRFIDTKAILLDQTFSYQVVNLTHLDETGAPEKLDLLVQDVNLNGVYDAATDYVLAGNSVAVGNNQYWAGTILALDFRDVAAQNQSPETGDIYRIEFRRPYSANDSILFQVKPAQTAVAEAIRGEIDQIKVVPNPYVATNMMEPAISNPYLNQRRRLLFTHIPAACTIKIFTSSGVFVDEIQVENPPDDGTIHWDMLTREGLEIAAGIYVYHVQAKTTSAEKIGKFAVIK